MSRLIGDLIPDLQLLAQQFIDNCHLAGIEAIIDQTLRTYAEQDALYAQGRTAPGKIVTYAKGGQSWHNFGRAFDAVPLRQDGSGRVWWDAPPEIWQTMGATGERLGLGWGGRWREPDIDHWELTGGMTLEQAAAQAQAGQYGSSSGNTPAVAG